MSWEFWGEEPWKHVRRIFNIHILKATVWYVQLGPLYDCTFQRYFFVCKAIVRPTSGCLAESYTISLTEILMRKVPFVMILHVSGMWFVLIRYNAKILTHLWILWPEVTSLEFCCEIYCECVRSNDVQGHLIKEWHSVRIESTWLRSQYEGNKSKDVMLSRYTMRRA